MSTALGIVIIIFVVVLIWFVFSLGYDIRTFLIENRELQRKNYAHLMALYNTLGINSTPSAEEEQQEASAEPNTPVEENDVDYKKLYPEGVITSE